MKNIFLHSLLCSCLTQAITAQTDTLLANSTHTMALFFSSPVRQAITGSENFTFSFNTNTAHSLGLLQAKPGPGSNLLVLTEDGKSYMFELKYTPHLLRTYRFIKQEEGLDNPSTYPGVRDSIAKSSSAPTKSDSIDYKKGSVFVLSSATNVLKTKRKYGLVLKLLDIAYYGREVYLAYEIENRSEIDYELDDQPWQKILISEVRINTPLHLSATPNNQAGIQLKVYNCVAKIYPGTKGEVLIRSQRKIWQPEFEP